jgi:hypothetical protein
MMRLLALSTALVLAVCASAGAAPLERLEYRKGRLTVRAEETPLADVIDALKRQSGAELHGTPPDKTVTAKLDAVPLREALERLLGAESFALTYGDKERLKKIELRGGPVAAPQKAEPAPEPTVNLGAHDGKTPDHWLAVLDNLTAPVPVTGRLREVAGTDNAGWDFVLSKASQHDDPALRADAIRAAVRAIENHPEMREGVTGALLRMDDEQLAAYVRARARSVEDEPVPFVKSIVRYSRNSDLRSRAHELIRQLRTEDRAAKRVAGGAA